MLHVPEQLALCQQRTVSLCWAIEHYGNVWHFFLDSVRKSKFLIYLDLLYFDLPFFLCFVACSGFSFLSMAPSILDCEHGSFGWVTGGAMKLCIRLMPVHSSIDCQKYYEVFSSLSKTYGHYLYDVTTILIIHASQITTLHRSQLPFMCGFCSRHVQGASRVERCEQIVSILMVPPPLFLGSSVHTLQIR